MLAYIKYVLLRSGPYQNDQLGLFPHFIFHILAFLCNMMIHTIRHGNDELYLGCGSLYEQPDTTYECIFQPYPILYTPLWGRHQRMIVDLVRAVNIEILGIHSHCC